MLRASGYECRMKIENPKLSMSRLSLNKLWFLFERVHGQQPDGTREFMLRFQQELLMIRHTFKNDFVVAFRFALSRPGRHAKSCLMYLRTSVSCLNAFSIYFIHG